MVLGHENAGKTVLLASLWRVLGIGGARRVQVVPQVDQDASELQMLCNKIEDSSDSFPASTTQGEMREWKFVAQALNHDGSSVDAFFFSYFDYPGEFLERQAKGEELPREFGHALRSADILVGVIDGQMVAHFMADTADNRFAVRLSNLCRTLHEHKLKTLHIVITKWDLLLAKGHELDRVLARLKEFNGPFRDLLESPRSGGVRVIPVSALGVNGFVYEDSTETMMKWPGKGWSPEYVVAPLGSIIPDVLATDVAVLRNRGGLAPRPVIARGDASQLFFWTTLVLGLAVPAAGLPVIATAIQKVVLETSLDKLIGAFSRNVDRARGRPAPRQLDAKSGLIHLLAYLQGEVERLERAIPASKRIIPGAAER